MSSRRESGLRAFAAKLRGFLRGPRRDAELEDEIQEHLQLLAKRFEAQGMPKEEAAAAARRQFGNVTLLQEDRRELQTLCPGHDRGGPLACAPGWVGLADQDSLKNCE